ncbi:hypothetical protein [Microcoleus sp.]|uniref:hypothetical protein n=1 Tax=Microcoleus sp. TaxID=44472 RepID=UPI003524EF7C
MTNYSGVSRILSSYLGQENGSETAKTPDNFGADIFIDDFEDEFPMGDSADTEGWTPESRRANEGRPWGGKFGDRPKVHEVNQPVKAQERGWRLLDLHPNRNHKEEYYRLAGTPAELRILLQLVRATREMVGKNINFEEWFEQWEKGFPDAKEQRNGNFLLTGDKQWDRIKKPESRPRFKEWTTSQQRIDWGFRVIEYWRDRSNESDSVVLSGTDLQLVNHVIQIEYEAGGSNSKNKNGNWPPLKGQPQIKLYFLGDNKASAEISLRIMDKTDDPKNPLPKIDKLDLKNYARKIKELFAVPSLFVWEKGREVISYRNRWQGFEGWYLCKNEAAGRALLLKLLAITDSVLDEASIRLSTAPAGTFPTNPPSVFVLGEEVKSEIQRPVVDVKFHRAEIMLPKLKTPIALVEKSHIVYQ